jgi:hypothetical protein
LWKKISFSVYFLLLTTLETKFSIATGLNIIPNGLVVIWNLKYWNLSPIFSAKQEPKDSILE